MHINKSTLQGQHISNNSVCYQWLEFNLSLVLDQKYETASSSHFTALMQQTWRTYTRGDQPSTGANHVSFTKLHSNILFWYTLHFTRSHHKKGHKIFSYPALVAQWDYGQQIRVVVLNDEPTADQIQALLGTLSIIQSRNTCRNTQCRTRVNDYDNHTGA